MFAQFNKSADGITNNILKEPTVKSLYIGTATFAVRKTQSIILCA